MSHTIKQWPLLTRFLTILHTLLINWSYVVFMLNWFFYWSKNRATWGLTGYQKIIACGNSEKFFAHAICTLLPIGAIHKRQLPTVIFRRPNSFYFMESTDLWIRNYQNVVISLKATSMYFCTTCNCTMCNLLLLGKLLHFSAIANNNPIMPT